MTGTWDKIWSTMLTKAEYRILSKRAPHGTHSRYNGHLLDGSDPCDRCRAAEAAYRAELRARRTEREHLVAPSRAHSASRPDRPRSNAAEPEDQDEDSWEDEPADERPWADDVEDAVFDEGEEEEDEASSTSLDEISDDELDDAPRKRTREWSASPFGPAFGKIGVQAFGKLGVGTPNGSSSPARRGSPRITAGPTDGVRTDPRTRLRAITAEIEARKPRGSVAIRLLAEAASYLTGGVTALGQYGEGRGCDPQDIAAAERTVVGRGRG